MEFYDTFDGATLEVIDGIEHITTDAGAVWANTTGPFAPYEIEALPGAVRIDSNGDWFMNLALQSVNGVGFREQRQAGAYHTRCLAYALIAERALGIKIPADVRAKIETRLWACQDTDGGLWTDYLHDGTIPGHAKKTNEIAPLTLLAYDRALWS